MHTILWSREPALLYGTGSLPCFETHGVWANRERCIYWVRKETHIPREVLFEYIEELKKVFTPEAYNLFHHNCNTFSNELATFLTGSGIPV